MHSSVLQREDQRSRSSCRRRRCSCSRLAMLDRRIETSLSSCCRSLLACSAPKKTDKQTPYQSLLHKGRTKSRSHDSQQAASICDEGSPPRGIIHAINTGTPNTYKHLVLLFFAQLDVLVELLGIALKRHRGLFAHVEHVSELQPHLVQRCLALLDLLPQSRIFRSGLRVIVLEPCSVLPA